MSEGTPPQVGDADPLVGREIAGYVFEERLGAGGTGTVYRGTQLSLKRAVALKVLSSDLVKDAALVERFLEEARAIARLNHPKVVQVHDAVREGECIFFAMEYLPGGTLGGLLREKRVLPPETVILAACDAAEALAWAEEHGIVHRDVKPDNLLIAADGTVKLADLGLALEGRDEEGGGKRHWVGSPRFMAPEQASAAPLDHRADIYALGCTLFVALTGRYPFDGRTARDVIRQKLARDPPAIEELAPDLPPRLAAVVNTMIAREPADRYASCADLVADLAAARREIEGGAEPSDAAGTIAAGVEGPPAAAEPTAAKPSPAKIIAAWSAAAAALIILAAVSLKPGSDPPAAPPRDAPAEPEVVRPAPPVPSPDAPGTGADAPAPRATAPTTGGGGGGQGARDALAAAARAEREREAIERRQREQVERVLRGEVEDLLERKRFGEARTKLEQLSREFPGGKDALARVLHRVSLDAAKWWTESKSRADELIGEGKLDDAEGLLRETGRSLPPGFEDDVRLALDGLAKERAAREACRLELETVEEELIAALAARDFEKAASFEARLPDVSEHPSTRPLVAEFTAAATARVRDCRGVWERVLDGLDRALREKRPVSVADAERPDRRRAEYPLRRLDREAGAVALGDAASAEIDALAIATPALLECLRSPDGAEASLAEREALGLLLLERRPFRARELLVDDRFGAQAKARHEDRVDGAEDALLARTMTSLSGRMAELERAGSAPAGARVRAGDGLAARALALYLTARGSPKLDRIAADAERLFVRGRIEGLRSTLPGGLFRGRIKSYGSGKIHLVYDFTSPEQLEDFVPVLEDECRMEASGGGTRIMGEFRLGRGNPFRRTLEVRGEVPDGGYNLRAPNVNVALWTAEDDRVTPLPPASRERPGKTVPADYFVFGMGFESSVASGGSAYMTLAGGVERIDMPAFVLLAGAHGRSIHDSPATECIWGSAAGDRFRGAHEFEIRMDANGVSWTIDRRKQNVRRAAVVDRLRGKESLVGSVSIFTNGEVVLYSAFEVEGELDPAWVDGRLGETARGEFREAVGAR